MAIGLINNTILKAYPSSSHPNPNTLVPLTIFDKAAFDLHVVVLYAFGPPMPSNEVMKDALSKVLAHFPHLAGRFTTDDQGRRCIMLNNAGVRVTETYVPVILADHLPFDPTTNVSHLLPPVEGVEELLQIQLNRYACGSLVIGQTAHHRVADGQSMSSFFVAWAKIVRKLNIDPLPYHDRAAVTIPRSPPNVEFDHRSIEFKKNETADINASISPIDNLVVHFTPDFINKLKAKVVEGNCTRNPKYSSFECLLAHVWKRVTQARGLDLEKSTQVRVAVNGRARIKPAVPMEYFGNLVLWAYPKLIVSELLKGSHAHIAKVIHDAVAKIDNQYFQSFKDIGKIADEKKEDLEPTAPEIGNVLCPNLEVDSWLRFQFHDLDFGGGAPCSFYPPNIPVEGLIIFLPSCRDGGGVDCVMTLLPEHVLPFKQISHSLD